MELRDIFPVRLDLTMTKRNISNHKLSQLSGVSECSISGYRTGKRLPKVPELTLIAKSLHISTDYLLGLRG